MRISLSLAELHMLQPRVFIRMGAKDATCLMMDALLQAANIHAVAQEEYWMVEMLFSWRSNNEHN